MKALISYALLSVSLHQCASGFGVPEIFSTAVHHAENIAAQVPPNLLADIADTSLPSSLYASYKQALVLNPLPTKMITGAIIAVAGDAIAQRCIGDDCPLYDSERTVAFAAFDASYRAMQHVLYPPMVQFFQGQYLSAVLVAAAGGMVIVTDHTSVLAAVEQALVSQLVIIPLFYYPAFYAVTGLVQGLSFQETLDRARETFVPLMTRNLLFWIPVQFAVFGFCEEPLQIPILTMCGLIWTIILSVVAGSVKAPAAVAAVESDEVFVTAATNGVMVGAEVYDTYCVTGMEPHCLIDPDDLFHAPHHTVMHAEEAEAILPVANGDDNGKNLENETSSKEGEIILK